MKSWNEKENSKKDLKRAIEVPEKIMDIIIKLQNALCDYVEFKNPPARATSIYFFQRTYTGLKDNDPEIIFYIVASLHLSSKVFDDARLIQQFIEGLEYVKHDKELTNLLPALSSFNNFDSENRQIIASKIINAENDIIYRLDFHFNIPLPYKSAKHVSSLIAHWHIRPDRENTIENFADKISNASWLFLNGLQPSHLFYKYPHDMVGTIAVCLACEIYNLPVPPLVWNHWFLHLLPFYDISEVKQAYGSIKKKFRDYMMHLDLKMNRPIEEIRKRMTQFYITPLEDYREIDELCPPPPIELMKEIAGEEDSFNHMWSDHLPIVEPPPLSLLSELIPKPSESIPRRRWEIIHNDDDIIEIQQCGIKLPPKPIIPSSNFISTNTPVTSSPNRFSSEESFRSGNHTPQQQNYDGQRRGRFNRNSFDLSSGPNSDLNMNSGQRYRYDTRDYDDQRNYDREKGFYNYRDIEYGRDNRDRFQDRPRPGMRSNRDIPQYRDQDFENQDFQDEKPSKTGFIPPPPPPPPSSAKLIIPNSNSLPQNPIQDQDQKQIQQSPSLPPSNQSNRQTPSNFPASRSFSQDFQHNRKHDDIGEDRMNNRDRNRERRDHPIHDRDFRDKRGDFDHNRRSDQYNRGRNDDRNSDQQNYENRNRDRSDYNKRDRSEFDKDRDRSDYNKRDRIEFDKDRDRSDYNKRDRSEFDKDRDRSDYNKRDRSDFDKDRDRSDYNNKDRDRNDFNRDRPDFEYRGKDRRDQQRENDFHQRQADENRDRRGYHQYDRDHNNRDKRNQNQYNRDSRNRDRKRASPNNSNNNY